MIVTAQQYYQIATYMSLNDIYVIFYTKVQGQKVKTLSIHQS